MRLNYFKSLFYPDNLRDMLFIKNKHQLEQKTKRVEIIQYNTTFDCHKNKTYSKTLCCLRGMKKKSPPPKKTLRKITALWSRDRGP